MKAAGNAEQATGLSSTWIEELPQGAATFDIPFASGFTVPTLGKYITQRAPKTLGASIPAEGNEADCGRLQVRKEEFRINKKRASQGPFEPGYTAHAAGTRAGRRL